MSWADVEDGVQQALVAASGFPDGQVVWSYQNVNEPTRPHIIMTFGAGIVIGVDRIRSTTDLTRPAGQEIRTEVSGLREVALELECLTPDVIGDSGARYVLEQVRTKLRLPSVRYFFDQANISPFDPGPITYAPDIPSVKFRGRASCTIRCYAMTQDCVEYNGYIARVAGSMAVLGGATGYTIAFDTGNVGP